MKIDEIKRLMYEAEDDLKAWSEEVSDVIFNHPELGDEEYFSSKYLTEQMERLGFRVTMPYCGLDTAFRCEIGDGEGPTVAFLAEYDALPGYGPQGKELGHACGHNWIAASAFAACAALSRVQEHFHGKVIYMGTPAEETTGRKINMVEAGAFRQVDAVLQMHLGEYNCVESAALAVTDFVFTFTGRAAHAAGNPELGINALDACQLTFMGINSLRQHVTPDVKIHGVIAQGGQVCNTIVDHGVVKMMVRAADKDYLEEVIERVLNCARGAALMTGCTLEIERAENTFYDYRGNRFLTETLRKNLMEQGVTEFQKDNVYTSGSTDIGNVSYAAPTAYGYMGTMEAGPALVHDGAFLEVANSPLAYKLLHQAAKAMAATALDVLCDPEAWERLKKDKEELY